MAIDDIKKLEDYADEIAGNIAAWEAVSIAEIAEEIGRVGKLSKEGVDTYKVKKRAKTIYRRIIKALAVLAVASTKIAKKGVASDFERWHEESKELYEHRNIPYVPASADTAVKKMASDCARELAREILNLTDTKALAVIDQNGNVMALQDDIYRVLGEAVENVKRGETDFYTAMRLSVKNLGGSGMRVDYGGGVTRRLDTVVRQNLLWGQKKAHKDYNAYIGGQIGTDGIEIDYHSNSRPSHRFMQGRQYAKGEGKTVDGVYYPSAEKAGVYARLYEDYGCRHYETDIILGVSEPRYSAEELAEFERRDRAVYNIGGVERDGYGWSQAMRRIETEVRAAKDEINALTALGGNQGEIAKLKSRIKALKEKHTEIAQVTGIKADAKRMNVPKT